MPLSFMPTAAPTDNPETALIRFLFDYADALFAAADLLGGRTGVQRLERLLQDLRDCRALSRRMRRDIVDLHRLLSLDGVNDMDSLEAACFSAIDPASPIVEDICLLADGLRGHLAEIARTSQSDPVWEVFLDAA